MTKLAAFRARTQRRDCADRDPVFIAQLEGWRHVKITDQRTAIDYAHALKDLSDVHLPKAEKIVLVQDNLNTHVKASLYEAFAPAEARGLVARFEWPYTTKHASRLNLAQSELGVLASQCLSRRIPDRAELERQVAAWTVARTRTMPRPIGTSRPRMRE